MITSRITKKLNGTDRSNVEEEGGYVRVGEVFTIFRKLGGLTDVTAVTVGGIACTSETVIDDQNMTAVAPTDDLLHGTSYSMTII